MGYQIQILYPQKLSWENLFGNKERYNTLRDAIIRYMELKEKQSGTGTKNHMRIVRN